MKKILFVSLIAALFLVSFASAYHYGQSETVTYTEDIQGENRGFRFTRSSNGPSYHECNGFYYFSYDNPCTPLNTAQPIYDDSSYRPRWDRSRGMASSNSRNSQQDHIGNAFATFQADSQQQLKNEAERTRLRYSGYRSGSFYSSYYPRYYSWGW